MQTLTRLSSYFLEKERKRLGALVNENNSGIPSMTLDEIKLSCLENNGYETPELNEKLYLHFRGFRKIENLEQYTGCRAIWLDSNGLTKIENLENLIKLRCLYLSKNLICDIENLANLRQLTDLDLSYNRIKTLDGLEGCNSIQSLNLSHNLLSTADSVKQLETCISLKALDITNNQLEDTEEMFQVLLRIPSLANLSLNANPLSRQPHLRKRIIACRPTLAYLDRPIDDQEKVCAAAWISGGVEAESKARVEWRSQQNEKRWEQTQMFKKWQREKLSVRGTVQGPLVAAVETAADTNCVLQNVPDSMQRVFPHASLQFTVEERAQREIELAAGVDEDKRLRDSIIYNQVSSGITEFVVAPSRSACKFEIEHELENYTSTSPCDAVNPVDVSNPAVAEGLPVNQKCELWRLCDVAKSTDSDLPGILKFGDDCEINSTIIKEASNGYNLSISSTLNGTSLQGRSLESTKVEYPQIIVESLQIFRNQMNKNVAKTSNDTDAMLSDKLHIQKRTKTAIDWALDFDVDTLNISSVTGTIEECHVTAIAIEPVSFHEAPCSVKIGATTYKPLTYLVRPTNLPTIESADSDDSGGESESNSDHERESSEVSTIASSGSEVEPVYDGSAIIDICALD